MAGAGRGRACAGRDGAGARTRRGHGAVRGRRGRERRVRGGGGAPLPAAGATLPAAVGATGACEGAAQPLPAAPLLHDAERPGAGAAGRDRVRDRAGPAGDPAPHREEPLQPAPAAAQRAPRAEAGAVPPAQGGPAVLPPPQPAAPPRRPAARDGGCGATNPRGTADDGREDSLGTGPKSDRPAEHSGEGRGVGLLHHHQPAGADATDEFTGADSEVATEGIRVRGGFFLNKADLLFTSQFSSDFPLNCRLLTRLLYLVSGKGSRP